MADVSVDLRVKYTPGFAESICNGQAAMASLTKVAAEVSARANQMGAGNTSYVGDQAQPGKRRAHALVYTGNTRAIFDNLRNNTLLKALRASGGRR